MRSEGKEGSEVRPTQLAGSDVPRGVCKREWSHAGGSDAAAACWAVATPPAGTRPRGGVERPFRALVVE